MKFSLIALTACCAVAGPCFAQVDGEPLRPPEFTVTDAAGVKAPAFKPAEDSGSQASAIKPVEDTVAVPQSSLRRQ